MWEDRDNYFDDENIEDDLKNLNKEYSIDGYEFVFEDGELLLVYDEELLETERSIFDTYLACDV